VCPPLALSIEWMGQSACVCDHSLRHQIVKLVDPLLGSTCAISRSSYCDPSPGTTTTSSLRKADATSHLDAPRELSGNAILNQTDVEQVGDVWTSGNLEQLATHVVTARRAIAELEQASADLEQLAADMTAFAADFRGTAGGRLAPASQDVPKVLTQRPLGQDLAERPLCCLPSDPSDAAPPPQTTAAPVVDASTPKAVVAVNLEREGEGEKKKEEQVVDEQTKKKDEQAAEYIDQSAADPDLAALDASTLSHGLSSKPNFARIA